MIFKAQVIVQPNDIPIRIFHPTIAISNAIFARTLQKSRSQQQQPQQLQLHQNQYLHQKKWSWLFRQVYITKHENHYIEAIDSLLIQDIQF